MLETGDCTQAPSTSHNLGAVGHNPLKILQGILAVELLGRWTISLLVSYVLNLAIVLDLRFNDDNI